MKYFLLLVLGLVLLIGVYYHDHIEYVFSASVPAEGSLSPETIRTNPVVHQPELSAKLLMFARDCNVDLTQLTNSPLSSKGSTVFSDRLIFHLEAGRVAKFVAHNDYGFPPEKKRMVPSSPISGGKEMSASLAKQFALRLRPSLVEKARIDVTEQRLNIPGTATQAHFYTVSFINGESPVGDMECHFVKRANSEELELTYIFINPYL